MMKKMDVSMQTIRQPAVAGSFYPARRESLDAGIHAFLASAPNNTSTDRPKALIVPHAGYIYSGHTAAAAYASLVKYSAGITRVVLIGPAHRIPIQGVALPSVNAFGTPLGTVELDKEAIKAIAGMKQVEVSAASHAAEHSLEVQLPFLQTVLGKFKLVPLLVGDANADDVSDVLDKIWGGSETLIVVSSDLSHFLTYEDAQAIDQNTTDSILSLEPLRSYEQACGAIPINGFLISAKRHHLRPRLIELCNSGDTAGDKNRVVGYASFAFTEENADE
jgi:MEMO1 family protein